MTTITKDNANLLFEARLAVDGPFNDESRVWREVYTYASQKNGARAFVLEQDGRVCGYVEIQVNDREFPVGAPIEATGNLKGFAHITRIGVVETARGQGIGSRLLQEAEGWIKSCGAKGVWLDYLPDSEARVRLYSRAGYTDAAEFKDARERSRRLATKEW